MEEHSLSQRALAETLGTALLVLVGPGSVVATLVLAGDKVPAIDGCRPARHLVRVRLHHHRARVRDRQGLGLPHQPGGDVRAGGRPSASRGARCPPTGPRRSSAPCSARSASGRVFAPDRRSTSGMGQTSFNEDTTTWGSAIFAEGIGTFILMFAILGIVDARSPGDFAGLVIGGVVVAIIMVVGPITGASLNPARAFGPELVSRDRRRRHALEPADPGLHPARPRRRRARGVRLRLPRRRRAIVERPIEDAVTHPDPVAAARGRQVERSTTWPPPRTPMKKLLNDPAEVVKESLAGLAAAHGDLLRYDAEAQIVVRADAPAAGQGRADLRRRLGPRAAARRLRRARACSTPPARARCSPRRCPTRCSPPRRPSTAAPASCTSSRTTRATS